MAKLEDLGQRGLPPPPAPTRRGANPWSLSETARKREPAPREEEEAARVLEQLLGSAPKPEPAPGPKPQPAGRPAPKPLTAQRRRTGFLPLLALLLIAGVIVKIALGARGTGNWRELIPALFIIFFIAQAWWRSRRRRDGRDEGDDS